MPRKSKTKHIIFAIHGLSGRAAWFTRLAKRLEEHEVEFHAIDLRGFGFNTKQTHKAKSPRNPNFSLGFKKNSQTLREFASTDVGHVDRYQDWLEDCQEYYSKLKSRNPEAVITVLGHSLGGVLASNMEIYPGDQLILSTPGYKGHPETFNPAYVAKALLQLALDRHKYLELPISEKDDRWKITNKEGELIEPSDEDELKVMQVTANTLWQVLQLGKQTKGNLRKLKDHRVLMIQCEEDQVVDNNVQDQMFRIIPSSDKTLKCFSNCCHDWIWFESVDKISDEIAQWL